MSGPFRHAGLPALVVGFVALAAVLPEGSFYLTNDDVAMRLLAEGRFAPGAGPTPFLLFMNVTLGALLATLYRVAGVVPWYDLLMMLTMLVSSVVLVAVWMAAGTVPARIGAVLLAAFFLMPPFATPQFSMAGMTAAAAGLALLARSLTVPLADDARRWHLRWGVVLLVWGALIRWEAAVLLLCQAALSVAVMRLPGLRGQGLGSVRPVARAVTIAIVLMGLAFVINMGAYRATPGWRDFPQFNLLRAQLGEYASPAAPSAEVLADLRRETGWSANDLALLRDFFFLDAAVFTRDRLSAAKAVFAAHEAPRSASALTAAEPQVRHRVLSNWAAFCVLAAVVLAGTRPVRRLIILAWLVGAMYGLLIVITATLKGAPFHLYWPMLVLVAGLLPLEAPQEAPLGTPLEAPLKGPPETLPGPDAAAADAAAGAARRRRMGQVRRSGAPAHRRDRGAGRRDTGALGGSAAAARHRRRAGSRRGGTSEDRGDADRDSRHGAAMGVFLEAVPPGRSRHPVHRDRRERSDTAHPGRARPLRRARLRAGALQPRPVAAAGPAAAAAAADDVHGRAPSAYGRVRSRARRRHAHRLALSRRMRPRRR